MLSFLDRMDRFLHMSPSTKYKVWKSFYAKQEMQSERLLATYTWASHTKHICVSYIQFYSIYAKWKKKMQP